MVSTYTTNKSLERPGNGDYVDTWNVPVNSDMTVIDKAFGGTLNLNATAGDATLSSTQYQNLIINITGAMSASVIYTIPSGVGGQWIVRNATTDASGGPWTVTFASAGGGTSTIALRNKTVTLISDGTNIRSVEPNSSTIGTVTSIDVSGGTTGLTTSGGPVTTSGTITIAGTLAATNGGTGLTSLGANVATWLGTPSSANLAAAVTDETGTGALVFGTGPTLGAPVVTGTAVFNSTGQVQIPSGTTAQRTGSPAAGMIRYNSDYGYFEGYGTSWSGFGGATGASGDRIFYLNGQTITANYAIPSGQNAMTAGPITVNSGIVVTVPAGSRWVIL